MQKRRALAALGKLRCLCGNIGFKTGSAGVVCRRCDDIESSLTHGFAREFAGSNRRGDRTAPVVMPFAFHCDCDVE